MSFIFIGHFILELINSQLQRLFYHLLRVWVPSLSPYHLKHLAWTFQVVYQTDAFSCKPPLLLLRISCPALLHLLWIWTQRPNVPRSPESEFKIRLSSSGWCDTAPAARHFHNGHSLPPSHHDRSGLRSPLGGSRHPRRGAAIQGDVVNMLYSGCLSRHEPQR